MKNWDNYLIKTKVLKVILSRADNLVLRDAATVSNLCFDLPDQHLLFRLSRPNSGVSFFSAQKSCAWLWICCSRYVLTVVEACFVFVLDPNPCIDYFFWSSTIVLDFVIQNIKWKLWPSWAGTIEIGQKPFVIFLSIIGKGKLVVYLLS